MKEPKEKKDRTPAFDRLCRLAGKASGDYAMIQPGDRLLLGVSGGKDSMVLLHVLDRMRKSAPFEFTVITATFDPGFEEFAAETTAEYCRSLGFEHRMICFDMQEQIRKNADGEKRPCMICSRMRRGALYSLAKELHCGKLVLAQHLDDILASFLISLTRGGGLTTMGPNVPSDDGSLRVIRPLIYAEGSLTVRAAEELGIMPHGECAYKQTLAERGDRQFFLDELARLEKRIPGLRQNMLHSLSDIRPAYLLDRRFIPFQKSVTV